MHTWYAMVTHHPLFKGRLTGCPASGVMLSPWDQHEKPTRGYHCLSPNHPSFPDLSRITRDNIPVLHSSQRLKNAIPESPIIVYRRLKNFSDHLVSSTLKLPSPEQVHGTNPCGNRQCLTCDHVQTGKTIKSATTGICYHTRATATCKTRNVSNAGNATISTWGNRRTPSYP